MDGPTGSCKSQDKTAVSSGIIWIILQQLARHDALLEFFGKDMLILALMLGMQ
jgi:hypothetical protein